MNRLLLTIAGIGIGVVGIIVWQGRDYSDLQQAALSAAVIGDPDNVIQRTIEKPDGTVQVVFSINQDNLRFNDALNMTQHEYGALSSDEIQQMIWQRFANWRAFTNQ